MPRSDGRRPRSDTGRSSSRSSPPPRGNKGWGKVARRGAADLTGGSASSAWRAAGDKARRERGGDRPRRDRDERRAEERAPEPWQPEEWIDEGAVRDEATDAIQRGARGRTSSPRTGRDQRRRRPAVRGSTERSSSAKRSHQVSADAAPEEQLQAAVGPKQAAKLGKRLKEAGEAFRRGRFEDARQLLRPVAEAAPRTPAVRELYGLSLYRLGRWRDAARELEAFRTMTGSVEEHPVLADCYRALKRYRQVDELWAELRGASPGAALVAEGRIVAAGALADQGQIREAIKLLEAGVKPVRKAKDHHLRVAYALADLYERAGDLPRARELFQRVAASDPSFVDIEERLRALD